MEVDASLYNGHGAHVLVVLGGGVVGDNDRDMGHIFSFTQLITMFHTFISSIISSRFFVLFLFTYLSFSLLYRNSRKELSISLCWCVCVC